MRCVDEPTEIDCSAFLHVAARIVLGAAIAREALE